MGLLMWQVLAGVLLVLVLILVFFLVRLKRQTQVQVVGDNQQQQKAILRLLDEMGSLADGDLTMRATVTEDITGAIADAVNYAVDALRSLVIRMDSVSDRLTRFARDADGEVNRLANASTRQANDIGVASSAIATMVQSIQNVSRNATSSADVAR